MPIVTVKGLIDSLWKKWHFGAVDGWPCEFLTREEYRARVGDAHFLLETDEGYVFE
jgi:hypothetical protein